MNIENYALLPCRIDLATEVARYMRDLESRVPAAPVEAPAVPVAAVDSGSPLLQPSKHQPWPELDYFDRVDGPSRQRYRSLLDLFATRPGHHNALSRDVQADHLGISTGQLDSVYANASYWMRVECDGKEPPLHLTYGDYVDPSKPHESYRWISDQDAQTWRRLRGSED